MNNLVIFCSGFVIGFCVMWIRHRWMVVQTCKQLDEMLNQSKKFLEKSQAEHFNKMKGKV